MAALTARGGLQADRRFAFVDGSGRFINAKTEPLMHTLAVSYDPLVAVANFTDRVSGTQRAFALDSDLDALAAWVSGTFGRAVFIRRNDDGGFPDDERAPGPTIVSTATLLTVASWFDGLDTESVRRRLRTNIEVAGVPPFWEDSLFGAPGTATPFCVGEAVLEATNPCARCVVPSRDPDTGTPWPAFAKRVAQRRSATLPAWANRAPFDHFYRLAVNTRAAGRQAGVAMRVGDTVRALAVGRNR